MSIRRLALTEFSQDIEAYNRAVLTTPGIDPFCSHSDWILPAHLHLMEEKGEPWLWDLGGAGYLAFERVYTGEGGQRCLQPLEAMWGLTSPLIGPQAEDLAKGLLTMLRSEHGEWDYLLLTGLHAESALFRSVTALLNATWPVMLGPDTVRMRASLAGGSEGFWSRRSKKFRKSIRVATDNAADLGITFVEAPEDQAPAALFARMLDVESRSWKGLAREGLGDSTLKPFYDSMIHRLAQRSALRLSFAVHEGQDIGYILGGTLDRLYRGLQFSYDHRYRDVGLGNLLQATTIAQLCAEGYEIYDLGTEMPYKTRWAEAPYPTKMIFIQNQELI